MVGLVEADDGDESGALQEAVGLRVASVGEDFAGVRIAPDGQDTVGKSQEENAFCRGGRSAGPGGTGRREAGGKGCGGASSWGAGPPEGDLGEVGFEGVGAAGDSLQLVCEPRSVRRRGAQLLGGLLHEAAGGGEVPVRLVGQLRHAAGIEHVARGLCHG